MALYDHRNALSVDWGNPVDWQSPLNQGLVRWYKALPGTMGSPYWVDLCAPGDLTRIGTLTNMDPVTDWVGVTAGRKGGWGALDFDASNDIVNCSSPTSLRITSQITVTCRFYLRSLTVANSPVLAGLGYDGTYTGYALGFNQMGGGPSFGTGKLCIVTYAGGFGAFGSYTSRDFSSGSTGMWWDVAGTWDGALWNTYVNGVLDRTSEGTQTTAPYPSTANFAIGAQYASGSPQRFFDGQIDSARIYNRALSAFEVQALYLDEQDYCKQTLRRVRYSLSATVAASIYRIFKSRIFGGS